AFGLRAESVDGQDVRAVYAAAKGMVEQTRAGAGPALLLANTYRYHGHHVGDVSRDYYRSKQEEQQWRTERDPIEILAAWLEGEKLAERAQLEKIQSEVKAEIEGAVQYATSSPYPGADKVNQDIYAGE